MVRKKAHSLVKRLKHWHKNDRLTFFTSALLIGTLLLFFVLMIHRFFIDHDYVTQKVLSTTVHSLQDTFNKIDQDCGILNFELDKTCVNFLTVTTFTGSEVGSMRVAHPEKWRGPYAETNPTLQGKYYYVYKTAKGYYLGPDSGIKLAKNKVFGEDVIVDNDTNVDTLLSTEPSLFIKGQAVLVPIPTQKFKVLYPELTLETD